MNGYVGTVTRIKSYSSTILALEYNGVTADMTAYTASTYATTGSQAYNGNVAARHPPNKVNVLFGDGHVETLNQTDANPATILANGSYAGDTYWNDK